MHWEIVFLGVRRIEPYNSHFSNGFYPARGPPSMTLYSLWLKRQTRSESSTQYRTNVLIWQYNTSEQILCYTEVISLDCIKNKQGPWVPRLTAFFSHALKARHFERFFMYLFSNISADWWLKFRLNENCFFDPQSRKSWLCDIKTLACRSHISAVHVFVTLPQSAPLQ